MTTIWDRAVRALHKAMPAAAEVFPHLPTATPEGGRSYYCGGPARRCSHATCAAVSALAESDLLNYPPTDEAPDPDAVRDLQHLATALATGQVHDRLAAVDDLVDGVGRLRPADPSPDLRTGLLELATAWDRVADELAGSLPDPETTSLDSEQCHTDGMAAGYRDAAGLLRAFAGRRAEWEIGDEIRAPRQPPVGTTMGAGDALGLYEIERTTAGWVLVGHGGNPVSWTTALTAWGPITAPAGRPLVVVKLPPKDAE